MSPETLAPKAGRVALLVLCLAAAGCRQNMHNQNKVEPYEASPFFEDGRSARQVPEGAVPRGVFGAEVAPYTGLTVAQAPAGDGRPPVTLELLRRGQKQYDIFCAPCHDRAGTGRGMIVRRGYKQPPSLHEPRLRSASPEHFVTVMTEGFGVMPSYAEEVALQDRWAITAYIQALQYSQNARLAELPAELRQTVESRLRAPETSTPGAVRPAPAQEHDRRPDPTEVP